MVGKTATLEDLKSEGFWKIFVGTGAGLPTFMNVPGEHLLGVMSANEFLTRVNLMRGLDDRYETPLPGVQGQERVRDRRRQHRDGRGAHRQAARRPRHHRVSPHQERNAGPRRGAASRAGRRHRSRGAARARANSSATTTPNFVTHALLDVNELGEPDKSGRRSPKPTGEIERVPVDLVIMALGNTANPIMKDAEPGLKTNKWGTIEVEHGSQRTSIKDVYTGGDAARGGSTAIRAAGDGQAAAKEIVGEIPFTAAEIKTRDGARGALHRTRTDRSRPSSTRCHSPAASSSSWCGRRWWRRPAQAGQFVRVLPWDKGELIPLTLADWDVEQGTIDLVVQGMGTSSLEINRMAIGDAFSGIAGPLGRASELHHYEGDQTVVFCAGGVGLPPVYPIMREHLRIGNHVTLISGFRANDSCSGPATTSASASCRRSSASSSTLIYTTNDGSYGVKGFVTGPLRRDAEGQPAGPSAAPSPK